MVMMLEFAKWTPFVLAFLLYAGKESFASSFTPIDNYLVACGSSNSINFKGRTFIPDSEHPNLQITANTSMTITSKLTVPSPLYQSARLFSGNASYLFKIQQHGRHWIRLYFHPFPDSNHNMNFASITVVTDSFVLLNNFTFKNYSDSHLFKEYAINITSDELPLTFIPHSNSLIFVNAIEVVSIPDELFPDQIVVAVNPSSFFEQLPKSALETVYRVNVGGAFLSNENDTLGRIWENDENYFHSTTTALNISTNPAAIMFPPAVTPYTAPPLVYATARAMGNASEGSYLSWVFTVDPNFQYFVRVHFCDIIIKSVYTVGFNLFINGAFAEKSLVLSYSVPYYTDFISHSSANTLKVSVSLGTKADMLNAIMNGLEIMKIIKHLDGFSSIQSFHSSIPGKKKKSVSVDHDPNSLQRTERSGKLGVIIGFSVTVLTFLVLLGLSFCYLKARRLKKKSAITFEFLRQFTFHEIQQATNDFDPNLLIGEGGFGKVYKGTLENGKTVAIKVANPESRQGLNEFHNEIELLSGLRHQNLVSLGSFGYVDPEYFRTKYLTKKSDVYSFGVVLIEVICGKPALDDARPTQQMNLALWALSCHGKGTFYEMMDPYLIGKVNMDSMKKVSELAWKCLEERRVNRPPMGYVLCELEEALHLELASQVLNHSVTHANVENRFTDDIENVA
ncbi:Protein kinase domain [Sesbania bispinosa]|nr:Protein kinase domain [Sesbania bispinosa]